MEAHRGLPPDPLPSLRRIANQEVYFSRPVEPRVVGDEVAIVEIDRLERDLAQLPDGPGFAGRDHVIVGIVLLKHPPHRIDVVAGESPIAAGFEISELQRLRDSELTARYSVGDLS